METKSTLDGIAAIAKRANDDNFPFEFFCSNEDFPPETQKAFRELEGIEFPFEKTQPRNSVLTSDGQWRWWFETLNASDKVNSCGQNLNYRLQKIESTGRWPLHPPWFLRGFAYVRRINAGVLCLTTHFTQRAHRIDRLADLATEPERLCAKTNYGNGKIQPCVYTFWKENKEKVIQDCKEWNKPLSNQGIRNSLHHLCYGECPGFRSSIARFVGLCAKRLMPEESKSNHFHLRILDPCAGWGDRLVGALSLATPDCSVEYIGVDPNPNLSESEDGYKRLIEKLLSQNSRFFQSRFFCKRFEDPSLFRDLVCVKKNDPHYDLIFTSPPYLDREIYRVDTSREGDLSKWFHEFLIPFAEQCGQLLRPDTGLLVLSIQDLWYVEPYLCKWFTWIENNTPLRYEGFLGFRGMTLPGEEYMGSSKTLQPLWFWSRPRT